MMWGCLLSKAFILSKKPASVTFSSTDLVQKNIKTEGALLFSVSLPRRPETPVTFHERPNALIKRNKVCFFEVSACHLGVK